LSPAKNTPRIGDHATILGRIAMEYGDEQAGFVEGRFGANSDRPGGPVLPVRRFAWAGARTAR
jgi:hypothetical protein